MKFTFRKCATLSLAAGMAIFGTTAMSQGLPNGPVTLYLPFSPGATVDMTARKLIPKASELLGQTLVIDNKAGGSGIIASQQVANAAPDGRSLLMVTTSHVANPVLFKTLPYDTVKSFKSVALLADQPGVIVVNSTVPVNSLKELIEYSKTHNLSYSSAGPGTFPHLGMELLKSRAGFPMLHVPYKGAGPAMNDLLANVVQVKLDAYVSSIPYIKAGKLKALAVTSLQRIRELPDVPTVAEVGYPGYEISFFMGVVAPASTPEPVRAKLEKVFIDSLTPEVRKYLEENALRPIGGNGAQLDALIKHDLVMWHDVATKAGITAE